MTILEKIITITIGAAISASITLSCINYLDEAKRITEYNNEINEKEVAYYELILK